jgi:2-amino-4-hydroxy-6-hydroxymethyldihydropteridine diphosphokinase
MKKVFLGIGTNLGDRRNNIQKAISTIIRNIGSVVKYSSVYETEPWGFMSDKKFLNMVLEVDTKLSPSGVLEEILKMEALLGRTRVEKQYSSRVIDVDILLYEDYVIDEVNLKIPHPHIHKRKFVLVPLCEIESELVHPVLKTTFCSLLNTCPDKNKVKKLYNLSLDSLLSP